MIIIYILFIVICFSTNEVIPLDINIEITLKKEFGCFVGVKFNATYNILMPVTSFNGAMHH